MRIFFLFMVLVSVVFSADSSYLLALTESDPSAMVDGKVNVITGDLYLVESDLQVQGYEPISLVRSYMSHERGDWMFIPHANVLVEQRGERGDFWAVTEKYGTSIVYRQTGTKKIDGKKFFFCEPLDLKKGFSNTSQGIISSETNLKNNYLLLDEKNKELILCSSNGSERRYQKNDKGEGKFRLVSEKLPNGKQLAYEYQKVNDKRLGTFFNLKSIASKNLSGDKTFARAHLEYADPKRKNKHFYIRGSDHTSVEYQFRERSRDGRHSGELESVVSTIGPDLHLKTIKHRDQMDWSFGPDQRVLTTVTSSGNKKLGIDYYLRTQEHVRGQSVVMQDSREKISECESYVIPDLRRGKVKALRAPVGPDASFLVTHSFLYDFAARKTTVYDIADCRTEYVWNEDLRLQKIDRYDAAGTFHNGEEFQWNDGNLQNKSFFDQKRNVLFSRQWAYDSLGNVKEETLIGNLTGEGAQEKTTRRTSYEGKWPSRQEEDSGLVTLYRYVPGTNLIGSKSICDGGTTKIRYLYEYDADLVLVREVVDDGISKKIRCITPCTQEPYYGLPEIIEEKYEDQDYKKILLRKTFFHYEKGGKVSQKDIYDAEGVYRYSLKMGYDEKGRLISETNPLGWESIIRYDDAGNKIFSSDPSGNTTKYIYDSANRLIRKEEVGFDGLCRTFLYTYDTKNNLTSETDGYGNVTRYVRTPFGKIEETHLPAVLDTTGCFASPVIRSQFDSAGNEIQQIDPQGFKRQYSYNARGKPTSIQYPGGGQEKFTYYLHGSLKKQVDAAGLIIDNSRDYLDRIVRKTFIHDGKSLRTEKFEYTGLLLTSQTDGEDNQTFYFYDRAGRKISEVCQKEKTTFHYDSLGRIDRTETDRLQTLFRYDLLDRIEERKEIDTVTNKLLRRVMYEYDKAGNITAIYRSFDGQDTKESFGYDSRNRLIWHISPTESKETFIYNDNFLNEFGQKVLQKTHIDPHSLETIETYDTLGRVVHLEQRKENTTLSLTTRRYDLRGNLSLQTDSVFIAGSPSRQIRTKWDYNEAGKLSQLIENEGSFDAKITKYTYTLRGDKETVTKPDGTVLKYTTNPFGDVIRISSSDNTVAHEMRYDRNNRLIWNDNIERAWDAKGRMLVERFPALQHSMEYDYNLLGQKISCKIPLFGYWMEYTHNALDMTGVACNNTIGKRYSFELSYDLSGNLQTIQLPCYLGQIDYRHDKASRKTSIQAPGFFQEVMETDLLGNIKAVRSIEMESKFSYDDLYQLSSERGFFNNDYAHDPLYCRMQKNGESYQVNPLNQLSSHFAYDRNGNLKGQGNIFYTYDALDRLIQVESPRAIYTFTYDAMHRKISFTQKSKEGTYSETRYFIYDGQNEIGSFDEQGQLKELRILGPAPHAEIGATLAIELNDNAYISISDLCGNIAALLSFEGGPLELTYYSAFGEESGSKISPWRFASKRTDEVGLVNFGRRHYVPSLGRWLTPDPLGFHDGMNLYAYVHNNPLNRFDEYGLLDFGQHEKNWRNQSNRSHKALVHEFGTQAVDLVRLAFSTPYYLECGFNYATGRQNYRTQNWQRCHNRFFNSATNWIYQTYSTDMTHPDYLRMRKGAAMASMAIGGYGLAKTGIQATRWGLNAWRGYRSTSQLARMPMQSAKITNQATGTISSRIEEITERLEAYLGKNSKLSKNSHGDLFIESEDGLKQFRMDLNHFTPHDNPHAHLIEYTMNKNKKIELMNERIFPIDVTPE